MKKVIVIVLVFLLFALIIAGILFKILQSDEEGTEQYTTTQFPVVTEATGSTSESPEQFVRSFYNWYLINFSQDPVFPHPENRDEVLAPWLTPGFLANWDEIVLESEVNPVLLTAEDPTTWGSGFTAQILSQSIRSMVMYVTLGSSASIHAYNVELIKSSDGTWRINSVASAL